MGRIVPAAQTGGMPSIDITKVFIVDDSAAIRLRLVEMLAGRAAVSVVGEAGSAPEAIVAILGLRPDTVLLDLDLNGDNGLEVLRTVHAQAPEIVFIVLTNHAEVQYRRACSAAGASDFLDKTREFQRVPEVIASTARARP